MSKLIVALLAAAAIDAGCTPSVTLTPSDLERLRESSGVRVVPA